MVVFSSLGVCVLKEFRACAVRTRRLAAHSECFLPNSPCPEVCLLLQYDVHSVTDGMVGSNIGVQNLSMVGAGLHRPDQRQRPNQWL